MCVKKRQMEKLWGVINKNKICFFQNSNKTENPEVNLNKEQRKHKCTMSEKRNNNA